MKKQNTKALLDRLDELIDQLPTDEQRQFHVHALWNLLSLHAIADVQRKLALMSGLFGLLGVLLGAALTYIIQRYK